MLKSEGGLISKEGLDAALSLHGGVAFDRFVGHDVHYTACGLAHNPHNEDCFCGFYGWYGIDGSTLLISPSRGLSFCYVPTMFEGRPRRVRSSRILRACLETIDGERAAADAKKLS